ncbi:hypothetical protein D3C77_802400 [compost metagenome]
MDRHYAVKAGIHQHFTEGTGVMVASPLGEHPQVAFVGVGSGRYQEACSQKQFFHSLTIPAWRLLYAPL